MKQEDKNDNYDRLWKMRNIVNQLKNIYTKYYSSSEHLAVEEVTVLFKGELLSSKEVFLRNINTLV
jgi:hypothetical protein